MDKVLWILLVATAGALLPVQAGLNARMGHAVGSAAWASLISFAVGLAAMLAYVTVTKQGMQWSQVKTIPGYTWAAGALGAFYVTVVILAFPRLGAALTFGLIVAGQLAIALALDHFNILVQAQHSVNIYRIIGAVLIVAGVILIRKF